MPIDINDFILDICEILGIRIPKISCVASSLRTGTMLAQCLPEVPEIRIRKASKVDFDLYFAVAHELRHIWQFESDESKYLSEYKAADCFRSKDDYNLQIAELDANAFAGLVMINLFGVTPLYNGLSDSVKREIFKHMSTLSDDYHSR